MLPLFCAQPMKAAVSFSCAGVKILYCFKQTISIVTRLCTYAVCHPLHWWMEIQWSGVDSFRRMLNSILIVQIHSYTLPPFQVSYVCNFSVASLKSWEEKQYWTKVFQFGTRRNKLYIYILAFYWLFCFTRWCLAIKPTPSLLKSND